MREEYVWGLDIGGTKCALTLGNGNADISKRWQVDTAKYGSNWERLLEDLLANATADESKPLAIGVSCGGPLNSKRGLILSPPNLPGWDEVPITDWLRTKTGVNAYLQNDANACALAEWKYGAGRGCDSMAFLTFGTGMGAGLILDGRLYCGASDMAGEIGHVRMEADGPEGYGKRGSFEGFCSGGGIRQLAKIELGRDLSAKQLVELAEEGDSGAKRVLDKSATYLGRGLSILIDVLNLQRIVIGSIYERAEKWFKENMLEAIRGEALEISRKSCVIVPAELGDKIGDVSAITTAWNGLERK